MGTETLKLLHVYKYDGYSSSGRYDLTATFDLPENDPEYESSSKYPTTVKMSFTDEDRREIIYSILNEWSKGS